MTSIWKQTTKGNGGIVRQALDTRSWCHARFSFLVGVVPSDHIFGTELDYDSSTGEIRSIARVPAGYGKVAVLDEIVDRMTITADRTVYVGEGSSDIHAMLHVNHREGFTISVSKNGHLAHIAKRTILSDSAFGMVLPVLEHVFGWPSGRIRTLFQSYGLPVQEWERIRTDVVTLGEHRLGRLPRW